ncbi:MAG: hypothetical protein ACM37Z_11280 [Deltaproteobacteria bacterium]
MKQSSTIKIVLWVAVGVVAGYVVWWLIPQYLRKNEDPRSSARLSRIAAELNRSVPVMIDPETELMPVQSTEGVLIYNYRLVNYSAAQINRDKFAAGAKQRLSQNACNRAETRDDFLKKGVSLRFTYYDKDKQHIATVDVTPADCAR